MDSAENGAIFEIFSHERSRLNKGEELVGIVLDIEGNSKRSTELSVDLDGEIGGL